MTANTGPATSLTTAPAVSAMAVAPAAAGGGARDATCLEPLVCFILIYFIITLIFILGPIAMAAPPPPPAAGARDATHLKPLVCFIWYVLYLILLH